MRGECLSRPTRGLCNPAWTTTTSVPWQGLERHAVGTRPPVPAASAAAPLALESPPSAAASNAVGAPPWAQRVAPPNHRLGSVALHDEGRPAATRAEGARRCAHRRAPAISVASSAVGLAVGARSCRASGVARTRGATSAAGRRIGLHAGRAVVVPRDPADVRRRLKPLVVGVFALPARGSRHYHSNPRLPQHTRRGLNRHSVQSRRCHHHSCLRRDRGTKRDTYSNGRPRCECRFRPP